MIDFISIIPHINSIHILFLAIFIITTKQEWFQKMFFKSYITYALIVFYFFDSIHYFWYVFFCVTHALLAKININHTISIFSLYSNRIQFKSTFLDVIFSTHNIIIRSPLDMKLICHMHVLFLICMCVTVCHAVWFLFSNNH